MKWKIQYSRQSKKFIDKNPIDSLDDLIVKAIKKVVNKERINIDVKKMKGDWKGYYRIRQGDLRVVLKFQVRESIVEIYRIGWRGNVYK